ncbi:MAG: hypothetical protein KF729_30920 [Sandaracinaceae bacterium]|nr:hypothetical protein [Sandaracinaceae bacterium]
MSAVATEAGVPLCASHEGAQSTGTCARCGNFVCPLCLDELSALPDHCEACREREGGGLIAFERGDVGLFARWGRTTRDVLLSPTRTFEAVRPGSLGASMGYVALTGLGIGSVFAMCIGSLIVVIAAAGLVGDAFPDAEPAVFLGVLVAAAFFYVIMFPLVLITSACVRATIFHLAARLGGGRADYATSLWATGYLHAIALAYLPLVVLQQIPVVGVFVGLLGHLAVEVFYALQLTTAARRYHQLADGRAALAGWSGFLVIVVLGITCCLGSFVLLAAVGGPR